MSCLLHDLQRWTGQPWLLSVLSTLTRGTEPGQINWLLGSQGLPAGAVHLLCWGWCCCQLIQSSLPTLEINSDPSRSSEELKRNFPLVFQIFCSRCSSHSAPLPRYGQMKPVRVCTHCYMFHVTPFYSDRAGIWHIKLLVCLLESYMDWYIWPKPRINLKEGTQWGHVGFDIHYYKFCTVFIAFY